MSSSLRQVYILATYLLGRSCKTTGRTRGAYLAGSTSGFLAMVRGTVVVVGMAEIVDDKLL